MQYLVKTLNPCFPHPCPIKLYLDLLIELEQLSSWTKCTECTDYLLSISENKMLEFYGESLK